MAKKAQISGTAHRTGKGKSNSDIGESLIYIVDGIKSDGPVEIHHEGEWVPVADLLASIKTCENLLYVTRNENDELREANASNEQTILNMKESLDAQLELAADWQRIAKHYESDNKKLALQIEELTAPSMTTAGDVVDLSGSTVNYHFVEGDIKGPMARIMEAIKELEDMKLYVKVDIEYDTPAGEHTQK